MAYIDRIVNVAITLRTAGVRQISYSGLMLVGVHTGANRVDIITRADDLLAMPFVGLNVNSPLYLAAQVAFSQIPGPRELYIGRRAAAEALSVTLPAIAAENSDWYGFAEVSHVDADLIVAAAWAEANEKLFLATTINPVVAASSGSELLTALKTAGYFRTAWWYMVAANKFPEVAAAARAFTVLPGGETWANMRLQAVPATPLTETQYANIVAKNGNTYEAFRGINITQNGKTAGGEWIEIIRFRDWLVEEIRSQVFNLFVDRRIPYTDEGIQAIGQRMRAALDLGVRRGGMAPPEIDAETKRIIPSYTISLPASSQISTSDRAAFVLRDVTFTARLAGAIHAVEITGTLTYDLI